MDPPELNRPDFAIVGLGRFGSLAARLLRDHGEVVACDVRPIADQAAVIGIREVDFEEAARARHIILCVPIGELRSAIRRLRGGFLPRSVVIDTCSVKVDPARVLLRETPPVADCLATHPLFGPDSTEEGLEGLTIVLCPLRRGRPRVTRRFLEGLGLRVRLETPEEHDRQIAETQAIVMWIGRALERSGAGPSPIATTGYLRLLDILKYVSRDSWRLFADIERRNPYAAGARRKFLTALLSVEASTMEGFEVVYRASGMAEAEVVKGYLESEGIPADLDYESAGPVVGLTMDGLGEVRVIVPTDWLEEAREALARRPGGAPPLKLV